MPFDGATRDKANQMAAYRCCICQKIGGVKVHYIIPKEYDGLDDIDNAAPLCAHCNANFGDNPKNRKEIKKVRDWWYKVAELKYPKKVIGHETLHEINKKVEEVQKGLSDIAELKKIFRALLNNIMEKVTPTTSSAVASGIVDTVVSSTLGDVPLVTVRCRKCNIEALTFNYCPHCGSKIWNVYSQIFLTKSYSWDSGLI